MQSCADVRQSDKDDVDVEGIDELGECEQPERGPVVCSCRNQRPHLVRCSHGNCLSGNYLSIDK
jgi:hypothetical protein